MNIQTKTLSQNFNTKYGIAIKTVPLPENQEQRVRFVVDQVTPVINQIITDAMTVAIGTWPTPEKTSK